MSLEDIEELPPVGEFEERGRAVVSASVPEPVKEWLQREAHRRSSPGDRVPESKLVREALEAYYGRHRDG